MEWRYISDYIHETLQYCEDEDIHEFELTEQQACKGINKYPKVIEILLLINQKDEDY